MKSRLPIWFIKIFVISIGFTTGTVVLELFAKIAPASHYFPFELPIKCENPIYPDFQCIFRRSSFKTGIYTKGRFPPFPVYAKKNTNDLGQFSNVDFEKLKSLNESTQKIISIGDSYTEALQVDNNDTFHGRLNNYSTYTGKNIISTAFGASGNSFPQYLTNLFFVDKNLNLKETIIIFPIISNDFDESFEKYNNLKKGAFFNKVSSKNAELNKFNNVFFTKKIKLKMAIRNNSALLNYLIHNIRINQFLNKYPFCNLLENRCISKNKFRNNIFDESKEDNPERFEDGKIATDTFLKYIYRIRGTKKERRNTLFIIDADRQNIYNKDVPKSIFFEYQRNYFIKKANLMGFTVIDMEKVFEADFITNSKKFEFINDGHWNTLGHEIVKNEIVRSFNFINTIK